jgi:pyridinium-3,5-biscarboxylic acid mononucleotide sulfurtransferase
MFNNINLIFKKNQFEMALEYAEELARSLGLKYAVVKCSSLADEEFLKNSPNRCYYCKKSSFKTLKSIAIEKGIDCIADGMNLSD